MLVDPALPPRAPHLLRPCGRSPPQPTRPLRSAAGRGRPVSPTTAGPHVLFPAWSSLATGAPLTLDLVARER
jgi:hypothetical protein